LVASLNFILTLIFTLNFAIFVFSLFYHAGRGAYSWILLPLWDLVRRCRGGGEEALLDVVAGRGGGGGGARVRREEVAAIVRLVIPMAPRGAFAPAAAAAAAAPVVAAVSSLPSTSQGGAQGGKSALALENLDPHSQAAQLAVCQLNIATQQAEVRSCFYMLLHLDISLLKKVLNVY
jgi:hypothetical protein